MPRDTHLAGHVAARMDLVVRLADAFEDGTHDSRIWSDTCAAGHTYTSICSDAIALYRWRHRPWWQRIWSHPFGPPHTRMESWR